VRLDGDAWSDYFDTFRREAFRLELLPQYLVAQEADEFAAFKAGQSPVALVGDAWHRTIHSAAARGAVMRRVHVVTPPLSDYLRFEFARYYGASQDAGEEIRILDLTTASGSVDLPPVDFWMFDERDVVHMLYEPDGTQIGRELLAAPDLTRYLAWRDAAWEAAVPFAQYRDALADARP
jgi:hypothetical protein